MITKEAIKVTTHNSYPLRLHYIFPNIGPENCEDIIWQNVIDDRSDIEVNEIGCCLTQSYQYSRLNADEPTIITRWQGIKTEHGSEFRIGLGIGKPGNKNTPPILSGNFETGVQCNTSLSIKNVELDVIDDELCIKTDKGVYKIALGEKIS